MKIAGVKHLLVFDGPWIGRPSIYIEIRKTPEIMEIKADSVIFSQIQRFKSKSVVLWGDTDGDDLDFRELINRLNAKGYEILLNVDGQKKWPQEYAKCIVVCIAKLSPEGIWNVQMDNIADYWRIDAGNEETVRRASELFANDKIMLSPNVDSESRYNFYMPIVEQWCKRYGLRMWPVLKK